VYSVRNFIKIGLNFTEICTAIFKMALIGPYLEFLRLKFTTFDRHGRILRFPTRLLQKIGQSAAELWTKNEVFQYGVGPPCWIW